MRDLVTWGTATAFLLAALYAVTVRREMVSVGRSIGQLSREVADSKRRNDNLELSPDIPGRAGSSDDMCLTAQIGNRSGIDIELSNLQRDPARFIKAKLC